MEKTFKRESNFSVALRSHVFLYRVYKGGKTIPPDPKLDYAANYAHMLGFTDKKFHELMRLYITIHRYI